MFAQLFRGRSDVYPIRWESKTSGKSDYAPACANEWRPGVCDARRLGTAIISHTCARTRQLKLNSCDRLFPNQDTMSKGGFGNLIALPLQKAPRERGFSQFVDDELRPYTDQWAHLASLQRMAPGRGALNRRSTSFGRTGFNVISEMKDPAARRWSFDSRASCEMISRPPSR